MVKWTIFVVDRFLIKARPAVLEAQGSVDADIRTTVVAFFIEKVNRERSHLILWP